MLGSFHCQGTNSCHQRFQDFFQSEDLERATQDDAAIAFGLVFGYLILGVAVYWQARYHRPY